MCVCFTDDFVPTRQRRFYNNNSSASASQAKGNALEIARQFRLQKQKTTTKPAVVSKVAISKVVKSVATDDPIVKPGMLYVCMYYERVYLYVCDVCVHT